MYQLTNTNKPLNSKSSKSSNIYDKIKKIVLLSIIILLGLFIVGITTSGSSQNEYKEIEVTTGDSLWSIINNHYGEEHDKRKIVHQIKEINNLDNVILQPGQTIKVPDLD